MRERLATLIVLLTIAASSQGNHMTLPGPSYRCTVTGVEKLAPAIGGEAGVCVQIVRAMATAGPTGRYEVDIKVLSKSRLTADMVVDGRIVPEQHFAIMDSELNVDAIQRFAASIAVAAAEAMRSRVEN